MNEKEKIVLECVCKRFNISAMLDKSERKLIKLLMKNPNERELKYLVGEFRKLGYPKVTILTDDEDEYWSKTIVSDYFKDLFFRICCSKSTKAKKS